MEKLSKGKEKVEGIHMPEQLKEEVEEWMKNRKEFNDWFRHLLHSTGSCFERDILRDSKTFLWVNYIYRLKGFPSDQ